METIQIKLYRKSAYVACAMAYRIKIDGEEVKRICNGDTVTTTIPYKPCTLSIEMMGNALTLHPIKASVAIDPTDKDCSSIYCQISTKINWVGFLTSGLFKPLGDLTLQVEYVK